jgi:hypothetical protein
LSLGGAEKSLSGSLPVAKKAWTEGALPQSRDLPQLHEVRSRAGGWLGELQNMLVGCAQIAIKVSLLAHHPIIKAEYLAGRTFVNPSEARAVGVIHCDSDRAGREVDTGVAARSSGLLVGAVKPKLFPR